MTIRIEHDGILVSLNHYKSLHWKKLSLKIKALERELMKKIVAAKIPRCKYIELRVSHNTKLDIDNIVGMVKPFVDCLRHAKVIADDTHRQWDYLQIVYDASQRKNTVFFDVTCIQ